MTSAARSRARSAARAITVAPSAMDPIRWNEAAALFATRCWTKRAGSNRENALEAPHTPSTRSEIQTPSNPGRRFDSDPSVNPAVGGGSRLSHFAATASARGSTGRERPGNLPHSGDLSAGGVVLVEDLGQAPPPSYRGAKWHDRAPAERRRDRRRAVAKRSPVAPQQSAPTSPWQMGSSLQPAAMSGLRQSPSYAGRASRETTQH